MQQTMQAVSEADLVCLIIDNVQGITPADIYFANFIRKYNENQLLIANKSENNFSPDKQYYKLGFGDPIPVSAEHGDGVTDLYDALSEKLGPDSGEEIEDPDLSNQMQVVIAGRPNAGKSTFINKLLGTNRLLTGPEAGVTRDAVAVSMQHNGKDFKLIDTAGMRKRSNVKKSLEKLSVGETIWSIKFANTVILMLDSNDALEHQDLSIANYVIDQGRSLVIVVNKWDLIKNKKDYIEEFDYKLNKLLPQIKGVPVIYTNSLDGDNCHKVLDAAIKIYSLWNKKITTSKINDWLSFALDDHPLPIHKKLGRKVRIKYMTQIKTRPPTFKIFANDPNAINEAYRKYLLNSLRDSFGLPGVAIRMYYTKTDNPYANTKKKR
jgi:GTP-binding protein